MWFLSCSYTDIKTIAFQVVQGLSFLNAHGIVNRNLSPVNIVFTPKVRIFTSHGHDQMSFWFLMHQIPVHSIPIIRMMLMTVCFICLYSLVDWGTVRVRSLHKKTTQLIQCWLQTRPLDHVSSVNHWVLTSFTALYCSNYLIKFCLSL